MSRCSPRGRVRGRVRGNRRRRRGSREMRAAGPRRRRSGSSRGRRLWNQRHSTADRQQHCQQGVLRGCSAGSAVDTASAGGVLRGSALLQVCHASKIAAYSRGKGRPRPGAAAQRRAAGSRCGWRGSLRRPRPWPPRMRPPSGQRSRGALAAAGTNVHQKRSTGA